MNDIVNETTVAANRRGWIAKAWRFVDDQAERHAWLAFAVSGGALIVLWLLRWLMMSWFPNWGLLVLSPLAVLSFGAFLFNVLLVGALTWREFEKRGRGVELFAAALFLGIIAVSLYFKEALGDPRKLFFYVFAFTATLGIVTLIARAVSWWRGQEAWSGWLNIGYAIWPFTLMFFLGAAPLTLAEAQWRIGMTARAVQVQVNAPTNHNPNYDPLFKKEQSRYEFSAQRVTIGADGQPVTSTKAVSYGVIDSPWLFDMRSIDRKSCIDNGAGITGSADGFMTIIVTGLRFGSYETGWLPNVEFVYYGLGTDNAHRCTYGGQAQMLRSLLGWLA